MLAKLRRDERAYKQAGDLLAPIYELFTEGFAAPYLQQANALLEELGYSSIRC